MQEVWKAVPDFEGLYEASTEGRIRSVSRLITGKDGVTKHYKSTVLRTYRMPAGYVTVQLSKGGVAVRYLAHRIVAMTFLPNPGLRPEVNHKDGVKDNNRLDNLEWMGRNANIAHAVETGLIRNGGERNPAAKLTEVQVKQIKELTRLNLSPKEIATAFGVTTSTITDIQLCRSWSGVRVGGMWSEIRKERGGVVSRVTVEILD